MANNPLIKKALAAGVSTISAGAVAILVTFTPQKEGREYKPYTDLAGIVTYCDGITRGVKLNHIYTDDECDDKLIVELLHASRVVEKKVTVSMPDTRRAAMIDWVYNLGEGNFARSTMLKKLNAGDTYGACMAIMDWMFVAGKDCRLKESKCGGIPVRRTEQRDMCLQEPKPPAPVAVISKPWWKFWS